MNLGANAVIFVFHSCESEIGKRLCGVLGRTGQHEADGMKKPHLRLIEFVFRRQAQSVSDVAQQHVGPLNGFDVFIERFGYGLFHQAFAQSDAQITADDLDHVLGFERRRPTQQVLKQAELAGGVRRSSQFVEGCG